MHIENKLSLLGLTKIGSAIQKALTETIGHLDVNKLLKIEKHMPFLKGIMQDMKEPAGLLREPGHIGFPKLVRIPRWQGFNLPGKPFVTTPDGFWYKPNFSVSHLEPSENVLTQGGVDKILKEFAKTQPSTHSVNIDALKKMLSSIK